MIFHVGQKVVFVGPDFRGAFRRFNIECPIPRGVYTIRSPRAFYLGEPGYLLEEIINDPVPPLTVEMLIDEKWLRPAVERKTSIEIFTSMLNPSKVDA